MAFGPVRICRVTNTLKDLDAQHLELMLEAIAKSRELLKNKPSSDTFAGRKNYEPFPPRERTTSK
jgi:hypothetical protein